MKLAALLLRTAPSEVPSDLPAGTEVLVAESVVVAHGERKVVRGVDLRVRTGEVVALVGPNGAGKSTLLGALAGDLRVVSGSVHCFGRELGAWGATELAQHRAVLPQQATVSFPFTVHEVVAMGRAPWARTAASVHDDGVVDEAIRAVDLSALADRPFTSLSGGERARASLARVLAQQTQLVLLDEPTAALDLHHQELVLELVAARAAAGAAVVVVVHDLSLAAAFADRVVVLDDGVVDAVGTPDEVLTPTLLSRVYRHEIDVIVHPVDGSLLVVPRRSLTRDPFEPTIQPTTDP